MRDSPDRRAAAGGDRVLVIKLGALGDVIQAEGLLHDIREHHPGARIAVLTQPAYVPVMERCPWVDEVIADPRLPWYRLGELLRLRQTLRAGGYGFVYDLQNNRRTATYLGWLGGVQSSSGPARPRPPPGQARAPAIEVLAAQLRAAGVPTRHAGHPDLAWMADDVSAILEAHGLAPGFTLLVPGASARHPQKRWPFYRALAERLRADGEPVATAPGPDELELCRTIPGALLLDGGRPLDKFQLVGLARQAGLVIGNDTGPTHLAAYAGARGLALFGPFLPAATTGIDRRFAVIEVPDLAELPVDRVYEAQRRLRGE